MRSCWDVSFGMETHLSWTCIDFLNGTKEEWCPAVLTLSVWSFVTMFKISRQCPLGKCTLRLWNSELLLLLIFMVILDENHFCWRHTCIYIDSGQGLFLWRSLHCPIFLPFRVLNFKPGSSYIWSAKLQIFDDQSCHVWHPIRACSGQVWLSCAYSNMANNQKVVVFDDVFFFRVLLPMLVFLKLHLVDTLIPWFRKVTSKQFKYQMYVCIMSVRVPTGKGKSWNFTVSGIFQEELLVLERSRNLFKSSKKYEMYDRR